MATLSFPQSKAKWIILGFSTFAAFYIFSKIYNKEKAVPIAELTEDDQKNLLRYKYQLAAGNGAMSVKRNMARFGDRHLIPHLFPGQDPNQKIPKKIQKKKKAKKSASENWENEFEKPKIINVDFPVDVFLRMRPLIKHEIEAEHEQIKYEIKRGKKKTKKFILSTNRRGRDITCKAERLRNVILAKHNNEYVFKMCIMPCIDALFGGTPCAAFAYGHSGSGKV